MAKKTQAPAEEVEIIKAETVIHPEGRDRFFVEGDYEYLSEHVLDGQLYYVTAVVNYGKGTMVEFTRKQK